jgi:hypothetical protein
VTSDEAALTREDLAYLGELLAGEVAALSMTLTVAASDDVTGERRWRLGGGPLMTCPAGWRSEAHYAAERRGVVAVRLTVVEPRRFEVDELHRLAGRFQAHGLQLTEERSQTEGFGGSEAETMWGVEAHLAIGWKCPGLLGPVLNRLLGAVRDAVSIG